MNQILQDTSPSALTRAIEENVLGFAPVFRRWPRAELHEEEGITWSITDIPYPLFNIVMRTRLDTERFEAVVARILGEAKTRRVPILWEVWPSAEPPDLRARLEKHGFVPAGTPPGMALVMDELRADAPPVPGLTIRRAGSVADMQAFMQAWGLGYEEPEFVLEAFADFLRYLPADTAFSYVGWQDGQPVATCQTVFHAGVAGIYSVATVPQARRQGIGTQIVLAALRDAQALGYKVSILHSSKMGLGVYRALGYREYFKLARYVRLPGEQQ